MGTVTSDVWEKTLNRLQHSVDSESFTTWLRPTKFRSFRDNVITIDVPSYFYKRWLVSNYINRITDVLRDIVDTDIVVDFNISEDAQDDPPIEEKEEIDPAAIDNALGERPSTSCLSDRYTFENFVVGESNRFAYAASLAVADPISRAYNPLFIYGGVGLGKTHLMQSIGHSYLKKMPGSSIKYITSEQFMNCFIDAITNNRSIEFRNHHRNIDLLMVDDVQFFIGKESTQAEFFHTFNALYDAGRKIVISSDRPPKELSTLEERLRSRFEWGLIVDIQAPDLETRMAILKKKAEISGIDLPNDVVTYIAERIQSNIRELEGVLLRLKAFSDLHHRQIDLDMTREAVGHLLLGSTQSPISIDQIQQAVSDYFDIKISDLIGPSRLRKYATPRHIAAYLSRKLTNLSLPEIGLKFGGRDHTSILHAFKKIEKEVDNDLNLANLINYLTKTIREKS